MINENVQKKMELRDYIRTMWKSCDDERDCEDCPLGVRVNPTKTSDSEISLCDLYNMGRIDEVNDLVDSMRTTK